MFKAVLTIMAMLLFGLNPASAPTAKEQNTAVLKLGEHIFQVPEQYSLESAVPRWLKWLPGLDDGSRDALLVIPAEELKRAVEGYVDEDDGIRQDVIIILVALTERELERYKDANRHRDLWYAVGDYAGRLVEPMEGKQWFRVYRKTSLRSSWELLKQYPDPSKPFPPNLFDYWLGTCLALNSLEVCKTYTLVENLLIEFSISHQNLHLLDAVKEHLKQRILSWRTGKDAY